MSPDLATHPRPTFARDGWVSLDGPWQFCAGRRGDDPPALAYDRVVEVPFPPESAASGVGVDTCEEPRYRRTFAADPPPGRRLLLHFEGVDHDARVWVNDRLVGEHAGGYLPFTCDVTDALRHGTGGVHTLVVAASDSARDLEVPRGKQAWTPKPSLIWYRRSSGLWRSVWLEEVPSVRLAGAHWVTADTDGNVVATVWIDGMDLGWGAAPGRPTVTVTFRHGGVRLSRVPVVATGPRVEFRTQLGGEGTVPVEDLLWSPERPRLIDIDVELEVDGEVVDSVASYTGLRTVDAARGAVRINGRPVFQRLVLEQGYWPDTHFTAPSVDALRAEAELVAGLGFNGLRMHQVTADPRFLRACDELGLLVWADVPAAQSFSPDAVTRTTSTLTGLVQRDRNHPSVIAWVPYNESWGLPGLADGERQRWAVVALHALARALDPTRLALGNDGWEHVVGDVVGVHDYTHDPGRLRRRYRSSALPATLAALRPGGRALVLGTPGRPGSGLPGSAVGAGVRAAVDALTGTPVVLTEFGGVSLDSDPDAWRGYGRVRTPQALVDAVAALAGAAGAASGLAGFCWTQLTDTLQEQNGLAWPDRTPKAPAGALAAAIRGSEPVDG